MSQTETALTLGCFWECDITETGTAVNLTVCYLHADVEVVRPYTPVEHIFPAASKNRSQESDLYLMIKVYPGGAFTPHLSSLSVGESHSGSSSQGGNMDEVQ